MIQLTRPLVFFDFEATGPDRNKDRIVQFCFHTLFTDGSTETYSHFVNPEMPISPSATEVHGITNRQVDGDPPFSFFAAWIYGMIENADLVGYGCLQFDVPLLFNELNRCNIKWDYTRNNIIDACTIHKRQVPRNLSAALKFYCDKEIENAHDAKADVLATHDVFFAQLEKHGFAPDLKALAFYSNYDQPITDLSGKFKVRADGELEYNFGQYKGTPVKDNINYLYWMLSADFSEDVKIICRNIVAKHEEANPIPDLPF